MKNVIVLLVIGFLIFSGSVNADQKHACDPPIIEQQPEIITIYTYTSGTNTTGGVLYTVPVGKKFILKELSIWCKIAFGAVLKEGDNRLMQFDKDGDTLGKRRHSIPFEVGIPFEPETDVVVEYLGLTGPSGYPVHFTLMGYLIDI
jgi:hypothetical protein